jgi:hypothetical protein
MRDVSVRVLASVAFGDAGLLGGAAAFPSVNAVADVVFHGKRLAAPVRFGGEQRSTSSSWYRQASSSTPTTDVKPSSSYSPSYPPFPLPAGKSSPTFDGANLAAETTRVVPPPLFNAAKLKPDKATKFTTLKTVLDVVLCPLLCPVVFAHMVRCVRLSSD